MKKVFLLILLFISGISHSQSEIELKLTTTKPNKSVYKIGKLISFIGTITNNTDTDIVMYFPQRSGYFLDYNNHISNSISLNPNLRHHCGGGADLLSKSASIEDFLIIKAKQSKELKFERRVCYYSSKEHIIKLKYTPQKINLAKLKKDLTTNFSEKESRSFFNLFTKQYPHPLVSNIVTIRTK